MVKLFAHLSGNFINSERKKELIYAMHGVERESERKREGRSATRVFVRQMAPNYEN